MRSRVIRTHQPGSEPIDIPETIPNPVVVPKPTPTPTPTEPVAAVGRREEAREIFEHVLSCRNHLGLLSEDVDPKTGELWGNFPQTYSMVGLIISAMRLSRTWEEAFWRG